MGQSNLAVVTGCAGFIGAAVSKRLLDEGWKVVGLDNLNDYYSPDLKRARLERLDGIDFRLKDLAGYWELDADIVIHLAAQAGVRYARENPSAYIQSNIVGFANLLERTRCPIVYASSSSVYGGGPFKVSDRPDPRNLYAATKASNELLAQAHHHLYGVPMTGLRFFTVYGPWGRPDMAYYEFTRKMLAGETITLYKASRDFTYIDDAVDGVMSAVNNLSGNQIYNIGNDRPETTETLVSHLSDFLSIKPRIEYASLPLDDAPVTCADISQTPDYQPRVGLREGLERFVDWYQC